MKKLYRKSAVHPTLPLDSDQLLSFLPAAILTLAAALSPDDKQVLAYLISCSSANFSGDHFKANNKSGAAKFGRGGAAAAGDHAPSFNCSCFRCYMSYWVRWDSSPNRQLIHEIIDAFEDSVITQSKKSKRVKRKGKNSPKGSGTCSGHQLADESPTNKSEFSSITQDEFAESNSGEDSGGSAGGGESGFGELNEDYDREEADLEKGSVRRFVNFIGERIWGVWT